MRVNRKILSIILCVVIIFVFSLTIAYAALSAVLTISGNAGIVASTWDIHLENPVVTKGSATTDVPTITSGRSLAFNTTLNIPGDFYEFTVDVVNNGTIDAMIEKVTKTPELTAEQAKYLKYEISYLNGESINIKQNISVGAIMPIKVRLEYRKDLVASDLPTGQIQLNLSLTLDYIQSDGTGTSVIDNGTVKFLANGNIDDIGIFVTLGDEQFYIISNKEGKITMLSRYNITTDTIPKQSISAPTIAFSSSSYWNSGGLKAEYGTGYPAYVYDANAKLYNYIENYKKYLERQAVIIEEARLIKLEELTALGCSSTNCKSAPAWVYETAYWSGTAKADRVIWQIEKSGIFRGYYSNSYSDLFGIRPVIVVSKDYFY